MKTSLIKGIEAGINKTNNNNQIKLLLTKSMVTVTKKKKTIKEINQRIESGKRAKKSNQREKTCSNTINIIKHY